MLIGRELVDQLHFGLDPLLAAEHHDGDLVARIAAAESLPSTRRRGRSLRPPISTIRSPARKPALAAGELGRQAAMRRCSPVYMSRDLQAEAGQSRVEVWPFFSLGSRVLRMCSAGTAKPMPESYHS